MKAFQYLLAAFKQSLALGLVLLGLCAASWAQQEEQGEAQPGAEAEVAAQPQAEAEEPAPEPPRYSSRRDRNQQLLAQAFPEDARWLELPGPEAQALALYRPAATAEPKGALLMLLSSDKAAAWSPYLENLRRALPHRGWASLSLALPPPEPEAVPERPAATLPQAAEPDPDPEADEQEPPGEENEDQNENQDEDQPEQQAPEDEAQAAGEPDPEPLPPRPERIANRLDEAMALLAREGQGNLVLLVDTVSAPQVMAYFQAQLERAAQGAPPANGESPLGGPVRAMVLVNGYPYQRSTREQLEQIFAVASLPVLDIFMGPGRVRQEVLEHHRAAARTQKLDTYQSWSLARPRPPELDSRHNYWVNRIQAFMHHQARGVEVPINRP